MGYALGSPYGISHGIISCLTLLSIVKLKAKNPEDSTRLARALHSIGRGRSVNETNNAIKFADPIVSLVKDLGLESNLA